MTELSLTETEFTELEKTELDPENTQYDVSAFSAAKSKWIFGHWLELTNLNIHDYVAHPEREKIALLIGAAHQQLDQPQQTKKYIKLARHWGCDNILVAKILLSGVSNTLGKVHALNNDSARAQLLFDESLTMLLGNSEAKQIRQARSITEISNLGLLPQVSEILGNEQSQILNSERPTDVNSKAKMLESEIELVNHNIALSHQKNQLYQGSSQQANTETFEQRLKRISPSQLGQDLWVLEQTNYKRGGFFVEFGATDGVLLSNTYLLEKEFGWQGICAEPNPTFHSKLVNNRQCQTSHKCIAAKTGDKVQFVLADEYGGISEYSLAGRHRDKVLAYKDDGNVISVDTVSLQDFLTAAGAPKTIDYLSIDTEGSEFSILETFPFELWDVRFITIEHNFEAQRERIFELLFSKGFQRKETEWDDWYFK